MKKELKKAIIVFAILLVLYLIIKTFFIDVTMTEGVSMFPTLEENQIVLVNKMKALSKRIPQRGDIVTFEIPSRLYVEAEDYSPKDLIALYENNTNIFNEKTFVKRVIGLPGEHIQIKEDYRVYINDISIEEEYLTDYHTTHDFCAYSDLVVPDDTVFVMGDNRYDSTDSRHFGCVPIEKIKGYVILSE